MTTIRRPKPHAAQIQVLNEAKRFNVLNCGRRWGKSYLATRLMINCAMKENAPVGYFTPTYKLLEGTFKELYSRLHPIIKRKHDNQIIELITGGSIEFWTLDNPLAGRSRKYKLAIVDEAAYAKNLWQLWTESIRPTLTDMRGDGWMLSTPKGKNDFYKLYAKGQADNDFSPLIKVAVFQLVDLPFKINLALSSDKKFIINLAHIFTFSVYDLFNRTFIL